MIVSYETFRLHAERFTTPGTCDLLICDEAHRLKVSGFPSCVTSIPY